MNDCFYCQDKFPVHPKIHWNGSYDDCNCSKCYEVRIQYCIDKDKYESSVRSYRIWPGMDKLSMDKHKKTHTVQIETKK